MPATGTYSTTTRSAHASAWKRLALVGLATVISAVAANILFYYLAGLVVTYDSDFIILATAGPSITVTLIAATIAVLVYAAIWRFAGNPVRTFTIVAAVVFVLSLIPTATLVPSEPGATTAQTAVLMLMHAIAAVVIVRMLTGFTRQQPQ